MVRNDTYVIMQPCILQIYTVFTHLGAYAYMRNIAFLHFVNFAYELKYRRMHLYAGTWRVRLYASLVQTMTSLARLNYDRCTWYLLETDHSETFCGLVQVAVFKRDMPNHFFQHQAQKQHFCI